MGLFNRNKEKEQINQTMLTDITRGLYHAGATVNSMLADQYIALIDHFFDKNADGKYSAKEVVLNLPDKTVVHLPLISLVAPKGLILDKMHVALSVTMSDVQIKNATSELVKGEMSRASFKVELSPKHKNKDRRDSEVVDIDMEFKACDPPEGLMRVLDHFYQSVVPLKSNIPETPSANPGESLPKNSADYETE